MLRRRAQRRQVEGERSHREAAGGGRGRASSRDDGKLPWLGDLETALPVMRSGCKGK